MANKTNGWYLAGSHPAEYKHGVLEGENHDGKRVAYLRCAAAAPGGFGTLMQTIDARNFRGKRVRLSGSLATDEAGSAGLWLRVDEAVGGHSAFDNMRDRRLTGTQAWQSADIVLDVGAGSAAIAFGVLLAGAGEVRLSDLRFEEVQNEVATTGTAAWPLTPTNLDFSSS